MKISILIIIVMAAGLYACKQGASDNANNREMYNAHGLKVITSFANRKARTMSVLYGNEAARQAALSGYTVHFPGEVFTLVTHRQANNKYWYGSYINGKLLRAETIRDAAGKDMPVQLRYQLEQGQPPADSTGNVISAEKRIAYILSHPPSVFP